jgi:hypothetical protein
MTMKATTTTAKTLTPWIMDRSPSPERPPLLPESAVRARAI